MKNSISNFWFKFLTSNNLIYNSCWEDPDIDRNLMKLDSSSRVFMITSAGDNTFAYLMDNPESIHTVDINPYQNSLIEFKKALFEHSSFEQLSNLFIRGCDDNYKEIYYLIRSHLPEDSRQYWDNKIHWFSPENGFYKQGLTGKFATALRFILRLKNLTKYVDDLIQEPLLERRHEIYSKNIAPELFSGLSRYFLKTDTLLAFAGIPHSQNDAVSNLNEHLNKALYHLFVIQHAKNNHFWRLYIEGRYQHNCAPDYLNPENFETISQQVSKIYNSVSSVSDYLKQTENRFSHFVLLDHQDWLLGSNEKLKEQWQFLIKASLPGAKILFRSVHKTLDFLPDIALENTTQLSVDYEYLKHNDKVGTYPSTFLLEVNV